MGQENFHLYVRRKERTDSHRWFSDLRMYGVARVYPHLQTNNVIYKNISYSSLHVLVELSPLEASRREAVEAQPME